MRLLHWFRALHIRSRYVENLAQWARDADERVHRLEIAVRQLKDKCEDLESAHFALRQRTNAQRAGRPAKGVTAVTPLDQIPTGDKAGLRAYFRANPPKADNTVVE